jgi:hypothetical protein
MDLKRSLSLNSTRGILIILKRILKRFLSIDNIIRSQVILKNNLIYSLLIANYENPRESLFNIILLTYETL